MQNDIKEQISLYKRVWYKFVRTQDINFWALFGFLPTFIIARFLVYHFPELFLEVKGVHIHHFTYGIALLSLAGMVALNAKFWRQKVDAAILYGIGLALAFDEFGMWLHLKDDYWERQSYDAIIIITAILLNIVYLSYFWKRILGLYTREENKAHKS